MYVLLEDEKYTIMHGTVSTAVMVYTVAIAMYIMYIIYKIKCLVSHIRNSLYYMHSYS